jgi:hypothetical protein
MPRENFPARLPAAHPAVTSSQATHLNHREPPSRWGKLSHLVIRHADACPRPPRYERGVASGTRKSSIFPLGVFPRAGPETARRMAWENEEADLPGYRGVHSVGWAS